MSGQSFYTRLVSHLLFPLHESLKRHRSVALRKSMEASQWWSLEALQMAQNRRLHAFMRDVFTHVPYYRNVLQDVGCLPEDIQTVKDLTKLPFLTKSIIRNHSDELRADNAASLSRFNTGGSSGEPLVFYIGKERISHDVAAKWRATRWWGVDIGDKELVLWGSPIELTGQDYFKLMRDRLLRTRLFSAFEMAEDKLDQLIVEIKTMKPTMLFGYPSALSLIAKRARFSNVKLDTLGIKVAFVTSEKLYESQRELMESVFGCPVANGYGGRDAGFIAHECPQGSMHVTAEDIIVEIVDGEGNVLPPGKAGEVVTTHLATRDFPFIRYRTGDIGVLSNKPCECGRGLQVLEEIQGRTTDFLVAQNGTVMHGLALIYIVRDLENVDQFKIIQESKDLTRIEIVPNDDFTEKDIAILRQEFKRRLGEDVEIDVQLVSSITPETSGKTRYVVSRVRQV